MPPVKKQTSSPSDAAASSEAIFAMSSSESSHCSAVPPRTQMRTSGPSWSPASCCSRVSMDWASSVPLERPAIIRLWARSSHPCLGVASTSDFVAGSAGSMAGAASAMPSAACPVSPSAGSAGGAAASGSAATDVGGAGAAAACGGGETKLDDGDVDMKPREGAEAAVARPGIPGATTRTVDPVCAGQRPTTVAVGTCFGTDEEDLAATAGAGRGLVFSVSADGAVTAWSTALASVGTCGLPSLPVTSAPSLSAPSCGVDAEAASLGAAGTTTRAGVAHSLGTTESCCCRGGPRAEAGGSVERDETGLRAVDDGQLVCRSRTCPGSVERAVIGAAVAASVQVCRPCRLGTFGTVASRGLAGGEPWSWVAPALAACSCADETAWLLVPAGLRLTGLTCRIGPGRTPSGLMCPAAAVRRWIDDDGTSCAAGSRSVATHSSVASAAWLLAWEVNLTACTPGTEGLAAVADAPLCCRRSVASSPAGGLARPGVRADATGAAAEAVAGAVADKSATAQPAAGGTIDKLGTELGVFSGPDPIAMGTSSGPA
mmetsp:Transcript_57905/g.148956  ORF Transcript_57905/g.148956 Transcript_57905/m.148956 type:complete len:545 (+) Transcript_57905:1132-2766(+)